MYLTVFLICFEHKLIALKIALSLLVAFFCSFTDVAGQPDTLRVSSSFTEIQANPYFLYFNTPAEIPADSAISIFDQGLAPITKLNKIHFGPVNGYYWFMLQVKNTSNTEQNLFLQIVQPHIYRIKFYRVTNKAATLQSETGIRYDFYSRPSPHRYFDFPLSLKPNEPYTVLMMVHHLNSLSLPVNLITREFAHQNDYNQNLVWGYWLGFLSFCALFALVASLLLRKSIFLWYFFYIVSAALYGFTEQGYGFQFLFPKQENMAALVIIQLAVFNFIFLVKFSQGLLETRKYLPRVHLILDGIFYFLLVLLVAGIVFQETVFTLSTILLPTVNIVTILGLGLLAFSGIKTLVTNRIIGVFYLAAYLTLVAAGIFSILTYGFAVYQYTGPNPILISYFLEAMILSVALVILFRQVQHERTRLMVKVNSQQKEMYQQYIHGIEKERSRIAGELHDDVGSRLSYLKKMLESQSEENQKTADQLDQVINDVRQLSHDLAPPLAHASYLIPLLEKLIAETRHATGYNIKFQEHNYTEVLKTEQIQQVYRIVQEALNNMVRHAGATHVDVQVFGHEKEVNITIEDNGKGFNPSEKKDGFGFNQMKIRAESIGAKIEINSHLGKGTLILVQLPLPE